MTAVGNARARHTRSLLLVLAVELAAAGCAQSLPRAVPEDAVMGTAEVYNPFTGMGALLV